MNQTAALKSSAGAPLTFPFPEVPALASTITVGPGVHWLRMPLPFALDHINLWLLEDNDGFAIVDTGYNSETTRNAWEQLLPKFSPITRVIATHYHPDHMGLAGWLTHREDVTLWATEAEYLTAHAVYHNLAGYDNDALVALFRLHGLSDEGLANIKSRSNGYQRGVSELPKFFRRITAGDTIRIGRHDWHIIIGHGHSPEHASLHCPDLGLLIAGDMLLPKISTNTSVWTTEPDGDPVGQFLRSIRGYCHLPEITLVLPAHGLPFRGIQSRVVVLEQHHADRLEELRGALAESPKAAADVLDILFRRKLDTHQLFFAMGEAIAHLNHLARRGKAKRTLDAGGVYRFSATP